MVFFRFSPADSNTKSSVLTGSVGLPVIRMVCKSRNISQRYNARRAARYKRTLYARQTSGGKRGDVMQLDSFLVTFQLFSAFVRPYLLEGFRFDLTDAFAGNAEFAAHLFKREADALAGESVAEFQYLALFEREFVENGLYLVGQDAMRCAVVGRFDGVVRDEASETRFVLVIADRRLKRNGVLADLLDSVYLFEFDAHFRCDFLRQWVAAEMLREFADLLLVFRNGLHHVDGDADGARLVGERAGYRLAYPPRRVGREFVSFRPVKFHHRLREAEVTLLDEIEKCEIGRTVRIFLGDGHDEAAVRAREDVLRLHIPRDDALGELFFLLAVEERILADLTQIHLDGIM